MNLFNWVINFVPVLGTIAGWVRSMFNVKLIAFLVLKGILFFLFYKFMPFLFGRFYQWIYDLGSTSDLVDMSSYLNSLSLSFPSFGGLGGWLIVTCKIDVCFRIIVAGAITRLGLKRLPFFGS